MFLIPVTSVAWRLFRAFCWVVLAVACGLVLDLAIVGLFVEMPGDRACAHPEHQRKVVPVQPREGCACDRCVKREAR